MATTSLRTSLDLLSTDPSPDIQLGSQSRHRIDILRTWLHIAHEQQYDIDSAILGKQTLDIGCGQGDMIEVFAAMLKRQGDAHSKVIGVDPASLDYGSPTTLGAAQSSLSSGPLHSHLSFVQSTAPDFLLNYRRHQKQLTSPTQPSAPAFSTATATATAYLAHSLYYFPSPSTLLETLSALLSSSRSTAQVQTLLLAEWALEISDLRALPHLHSVLLQSLAPLPDGNVRTVLSPRGYVELARQAGWEVVGERVLTPREELEDGKWEVRFAREVVDVVRMRARTQTQIQKPKQGQGSNGESDEGEKMGVAQSIEAHSDALESALKKIGGVENVRCMDVWVGVFRPAAKQ